MMSASRILLRLLALGFLSLARLSAADKPSLNLFAWSEYIPAGVMTGFTHETGIAVNYETFASGEEMLSKMLAGGTAYDLIQPPEYIVEALIKAKKLAPLDFGKISNFKNILPEFVKMPFDPEQTYTIPYMTGTVGIVVNTEVVKESIKGFKDVFVSQHANRIVTVNDNREIVSWALNSLGLGANDLSPENLKKARGVLKTWIPMIKLFDSDSPKTALLNGDVDLGVVWSGEAALLYNENKKFAYVLPSEGAHEFIDVLAIPANASHREAAHLFMNYILRPEVSKLISDAFPYTNPNGAARKLLSPEALSNPASYPPAGKLETFHDIGKSGAAIDKMLTDLKASK